MDLEFRLILQKIFDVDKRVKVEYSIFKPMPAKTADETSKIFQVEFSS